MKMKSINKQKIWQIWQGEGFWSRKKLRIVCGALSFKYFFVMTVCFIFSSTRMWREMSFQQLVFMLAMFVVVSFPNILTETIEKIPRIASRFSEKAASGKGLENIEDDESNFSDIEDSCDHTS